MIHVFSPCLKNALPAINLFLRGLARFLIHDLLLWQEPAPAQAGVYRPRHPERTVLYRVLFHCLVTEGGEDSEGKFHHLAEFEDSLLAEFFKREVFALLLREEIISEALDLPSMRRADANHRFHRRS